MTQANGKGKRKTTTKRVKISEMERVKSPQFLSVYANSTNVASSFLDARFLFGQVLGSPTEAEHIEDSVSVTMTWEHVVRLRDLLINVVKVYEDKNGSIRLMDKTPAKK